MAERTLREFWARAFPPKPDRYVNIGCNEAPCEVAPWRLPWPNPFARGGVRGNSTDAALVELGWVGAHRLTGLLRRFPDARACLSADALTENGFDLTRLRWSALRSKLAIEVCLFRIHDAMSDPDRSKAWFEGVGARASGRDWGSPYEGWRNVSGVWGDSDAPFSRMAVFYETGIPSVSLLISPEGSVRSVTIHYARK